MSRPKSEAMVVMGRVRAPHGVKGWIRIQPFTEQIEGLLGYPEWWLGGNGGWRRHRVAEAAVHGAAVLARLENCADRDTAAGFNGREVAVPRSQLPSTEEGEFYWNDLLGAEVINGRGELLGRVARLLDTGANQVLILEGDRERLVPFVANVVLGVDLASRRLVVNWEADY